MCQSHVESEMLAIQKSGQGKSKTFTKKQKKKVFVDQMFKATIFNRYLIYATYIL